MADRTWWTSRSTAIPQSLSLFYLAMDDEARGVPEWVVTYGDMMSLLLTFFIMLVSMSEVKADQRFRSVLESITQYLGYPATPESVPGKNFPMNSLIERLEELGSHVNDEDGGGGLRRQSLTGKDIRPLRNRDGIPVPAGSIPFEPGSAELGEAAEQIITEIAIAIAGKPHKIEVSGYAPNIPAMRNRDAGTVESDTSSEMLAYRRARVVLERLEQKGIRHDRLRIAIGRVVPRLIVDDLSESPNRVDVLVFDQFSNELVGPRVE